MWEGSLASNSLENPLLPRHLSVSGGFAGSGMSFVSGGVSFVSGGRQADGGAIHSLARVYI